MTFEGEGDATTEKFELQGGFVAVEASVEPSDTVGNNWDISIKNPPENNESRAVAGGNADQTEGVWGFYLPADEWVLDVRVDGPWTATVRQPRVTSGEGEDLPVEKEGDYRGAYFPVNLEDPTSASATHEGGTEFRVFRHDKEFDVMRPVFTSMSGDFEDETTINYEGTTWVTVVASGPWELSMTSG